MRFCSRFFQSKNGCCDSVGMLISFIAPTVQRKLFENRHETEKSKSEPHHYHNVDFSSFPSRFSLSLMLCHIFLSRWCFLGEHAHTHTHTHPPSILVNEIKKRFPADNLAEWNNGNPLGLRTVHAYVLVFDLGNLDTFQVSEFVTISISIFPGW
jgi:hypothetical protein